MRLPVAGARTKGWWLVGHDDVGRKALQFADPDRLAFGHLADAGLFAQSLGRADAGAHAAEDVCRQDRLAGAVRIAGQDLADEHRNVDAGRARRDARRVVAEIAAVGLDEGLMLIQRRMEIAEIRRVFVGLEPSRRDIGCALNGHGLSDAPARLEELLIIWTNFQ